MEMLCSPGNLISWKYPKQGLQDIAGAFAAITLDIGSLLGFHAYHVVGWRKRSGDKSYHQWAMDNPEAVSQVVLSALKTYKEHRLKCSMAYANFLPPHLGQEEDSEDFFLELCNFLPECVSVAGKAGLKFLLVRPLAVGIGYRDKWEANRELYLSLAEAANDYDLQILLEGQYRIHNGSFVRGLCADPHEALSWIEELNHEAGYDCFGFHMDVGLCSLLGQNMYEVVDVLGNHIKAVTIRDSDGMGDSALLPFTSAAGVMPRTDWLNLIRGLRNISFNGLLIMNFSSTAAITSPLLKPALLSYAKSVGEFLTWQIGMENILKHHEQRVLFGAGNMCRAYMKCYGQKYPPLFTCDNDKNKWGKIFCGLEVKNPVELRSLPEECAILICNIYYREIEDQLRQLGVKNPIGFFNDEYMPSFHFERIEDMEEENAVRDWGANVKRT